MGGERTEESRRRGWRRGEGEIGGSGKNREREENGEEVERREGGEKKNSGLGKRKMVRIEAKGGGYF